MFFFFVPVRSSFRSGIGTDVVIARSLPLGLRPASRSGLVSVERRYTGARDEAVGLYIVEPTGRWRLVDPDGGQPVCVCPSCWPAAERALRRGAGLTVRQLVPRPSWARCGVCDPDDPC